MKKLGLILIALFCFGVFSEVMAASLDKVFVISDVYEYDQGDFPGLPGGSRILIGSSSYVPTEPVTVDSTPTGDGASLTYPLSGWDMWVGVFPSPAIGINWATTYTFHSASDTARLDLSNCTFSELNIPQNVVLNGNTISWDPVEHATSYKLRWFHWNDGDTPDIGSGFLAETDYLDQPSYTMTNPVPGEYALRVEAFEFCEDHELNKSQLYVKHVIEDLSGGDYDYYLPYYASVNNYWTGLGLINRNRRDPTRLQVTVYDREGNALATENKIIPAYGQDAFPVATQLNDSGWMWVNSHQPISGLAFLGSGGTPSLIADIPFISELSSCLVIPHIAQDNTWDTTILICNPNNETVSVALKYIDKAGVVQGTQNYSIPAHGGGEYLLSTVFSDKIPLAGRLKINSSIAIAAFALYNNQKSGGSYYAGINAGSCE